MQRRIDWAQFSNNLQGLTPPISSSEWSSKQLLRPGHHSITRSGDQNLKDFHVIIRKITGRKTIYNSNMKEASPVKRSSGKSVESEQN